VTKFSLSSQSAVQTAFLLRVDHVHINLRPFCFCTSIRTPRGSSALLLWPFDRGSTNGYRIFCAERRPFKEIASRGRKFKAINIMIAVFHSQIAQILVHLSTLETAIGAESSSFEKRNQTTSALPAIKITCRTVLLCKGWHLTAPSDFQRCPVALLCASSQAFRSRGNP